MFITFGKGRHRAALNIGDCFAYALAKATGAATASPMAASTVADQLRWSVRWTEFLPPTQKSATRSLQVHVRWTAPVENAKGTVTLDVAAKKPGASRLGMGHTRILAGGAS